MHIMIMISVKNCHFFIINSIIKYHFIFITSKKVIEVGKNIFNLTLFGFLLLWLFVTNLLK